MRITCCSHGNKKLILINVWPKSEIKSVMPSLKSLDECPVARVPGAEVDLQRRKRIIIITALAHVSHSVCVGSQSYLSFPLMGARMAYKSGKKHKKRRATPDIRRVREIWWISPTSDPFSLSLLHYHSLRLHIRTSLHPEPLLLFTCRQVLGF